MNITLTLLVITLVNGFQVENSLLTKLTTHSVNIEFAAEEMMPGYARGLGDKSFILEGKSEVLVLDQYSPEKQVRVDFQGLIVSNTAVSPEGQLFVSTLDTSGPSWVKRVYVLDISKKAAGYHQISLKEAGLLYDPENVDDPFSLYFRKMFFEGGSLYVQETQSFESVDPETQKVDKRVLVEYFELIVTPVGDDFEILGRGSSFHPTHFYPKSIYNKNKDSWMVRDGYGDLIFVTALVPALSKVKVKGNLKVTNGVSPLALPDFISPETILAKNGGFIPDWFETKISTSEISKITFFGRYSGNEFLIAYQNPDNTLYVVKVNSYGEVIELVGHFDNMFFLGFGAEKNEIRLLRAQKTNEAWLFEVYSYPI